MPQEKYTTLQLVRDIYRFIKPYKVQFFFATFLRTVSEIVWLYPAYAIASITAFFAAYQPGQDLAPFWTVIYLLVSVTVVGFVTIYKANKIGYFLAEKIAIDAKLQVLRHMFSIDIEWHEKENTGNKVKKIDRGAIGINQIIRAWFNTFILIIVRVFGIIFIIVYFDLVIGSTIAAFLFVYFLLSTFFTRRSKAAKLVENIKDEEFSGLIFESINNIRSAKVMTMLRPLTNKLRVVGDQLYELVCERIYWNQVGGVTKDSVVRLFRVMIIVFVALGIVQGHYEIGFLTLIYVYFNQVQDAVGKLAEATQEFVVRQQDVARMMSVLNVVPITDVEEGKVAMPSEWKKIVVENVSFSYGDKKILDNVSFTINRGEKIGIVGLSGAGKSTLFKLLLKERETYTGEILIDGVPLRTISKTDYFKHVAVVLQDTEVFNFSLKDNISISNYDRQADEALLEKSLTIAHVSEFARALPKGLDTQIGEKGVRLSGGEKQRVGVARAVFKDPEFLLLDEATSHLDVESEEKIQDSLHTFFKSVTAVVIAHRLTTIKEMDKILVMEGGSILEQGSFADLYARKGRFYELWEKQKL